MCIHIANDNAYFGEWVGRTVEKHNELNFPQHDLWTSDMALHRKHQLKLLVQRTWNQTLAWVLAFITKYFFAQWLCVHDCKFLCFLQRDLEQNQQSEHPLSKSYEQALGRGSRSLELAQLGAGATFASTAQTSSSLFGNAGSCAVAWLATDCYLFSLGCARPSLQFAAACQAETAVAVLGTSWSHRLMIHWGLCLKNSGHVWRPLLL